MASQYIHLNIVRYNMTTEGFCGDEPRVMDDAEFTHDCPRAYTLVTLGIKDGVVVRDRLIGVYLKKKDAIKNIRENTFDLYECGYYSHALVEAIRLNTLYAAFNEEPIEWYKWESDEETGGYQPTVCPAEYEMVCGWGF
jgi:hypothetical protein